MLVVAAEAVIAEGAVDAVREILRSMEDETRKESGCVTYAFSMDVNDPGMLRIFERWESMEALEKHFKSPHMAAFGAAIGKLQPKSLHVTLYEVARELPLPRS